MRAFAEQKGIQANMTQLKHAVILAAGMGTRLRPITDHVPKCLTEVHGKPILCHEMDALIECGVEHVTIVVGFKGDIIQERIGASYKTLRVDYRSNDIYADTNSMYSAWIARDILEQGAYLIEGDVVIRPDVLKRAANDSSGRTLWLTDRFGPQSDGSMSVTDSEGRIQEIRIVRETLDAYPDNLFKSAGILKIQPDYGKAFSRWLDDNVEKGNTKVYYDLVLAENLQELPIYICNVEGLPWMEVDTLDDLRIAERLFERTKNVIVVMDGAADLPIESLDGKTPLQVAKIPAIDAITKRGRTGMLQTMYPGVPIDSITGNMGILGFDPSRYYPAGRASFEAMAQGIYLEDNDIVFRCNLISLEDDRRIKDFTSDNIATRETVRVINQIQLDRHDLELYSGQSYRNTLVVRNAPCLAKDIVAAAPHQNMGVPIENIMLRGTTPEAQAVAEQLNAMMIRSIEQVAHINTELNTAADMLWLWSPSSCPKMPSFTERFGMRGAIVAGLDFMRGIGEATGMQTKEIHGANGYLDTAYREKLKYAKMFLLHNDFLFLHVNAPDEEGHAGRVDGKIQALENIDREIVGPLVDYMDNRYPDNYRIAVLPDHYTCLADAQHLDTPIPYCMAGVGIEPDSVMEYTETDVSSVHSNVTLSIDFLRMLTTQTVS